MYKTYEEQADELDQSAYPADGGVATVTGAGAITYGAWTELIATTSNEMWLTGIHCELDQVDNYTIEIGVGAAGSESKISDFVAKCQAVNTTVVLSCEPRHINAGVRVAARIKTVGGGNDTISNLQIIVKE